MPYDHWKAMKRATEIVFPNTHHRWCLWRITKKVFEKLRVLSVWVHQKGFAAFCGSLPVRDFEPCCACMVTDYDLVLNEWLEVSYKEWTQQVHVYLKKIFLLEFPQPGEVKPWVSLSINTFTLRKNWNSLTSGTRMHSKINVRKKSMPTTSHLIVLFCVHTTTTHME